MTARTQVGIVGAGPAGLMLAHLLGLGGIESVVLESRSRTHVEHRVRAGVIEQATRELLIETGVGARMEAESLVHRGIELRFLGESHRLPLSELTAGKAITVYGQQELVKDLIAARAAAGGATLFEVADVELAGLDSPRPSISYVCDGRRRQLACDVVAGCDGYHGVSRSHLPPSIVKTYERNYPFAWLGVLVDAPPASDELIYAGHERGFALHSLRSPTLSRLYLQVDPETDLAEWPEERIWSELSLRLEASRFGALNRGPLLEVLVAPLRSFVVEPMRFGRLALAGDAAHIVPATGAKGLNLAIADVVVLAEAIRELELSGSEAGLDCYSRRCLERVWRVQHFSWWMTEMLHRRPDADPFDRALQLAQLRYVTSSSAAAATLAENYVGLPLPEVGRGGRRATASA
jgi:p-hydroxybenzoate 3-monooxygenase